MVRLTLSTAAVIAAVLAGAGWVKVHAVYRYGPPRAVVYLAPPVGWIAAVVFSVAATVAS